MKKLLVIALITMLAVSMVGCGGAEEASDTIRIGVNYELSGPVATYGNNTVDGIKLAIAEVNAAGGINGKQVEAVILDNKSDPAEALSVATKLMAEENIIALLGPATSGACLNVVPAATDAGIPMLTGSATNPDVTVDPKTGETREFIFRTCFTDPPQAIVGAAFAMGELGAKKVAIFYDNTNDYSKGLYKVFKAEVEAAGGEVVAEEGFSADDQEFRPTLTKFKNAGAELIYVPAYYEKVAKIISQARELGIEVPFLGADGWDSPDLVAIAGADVLNNTFFTNHFSSSDTAPVVADFIAAFQAEYDEVPGSFQALGYDTAMLLMTAIETAGSEDPQAITEALAATTDYPAVTGTLSFDEEHNPIKEIAIIEMVDGEQVLKTKIAPSK
jgi:branched-chain amino acid transport system substrate-binding protein